MALRDVYKKSGIIDDPEKLYRNEYVTNRNENIPDRYWNAGKPKLPKNQKFFRE